MNSECSLHHVRYIKYWEKLSDGTQKLSSACPTCLNLNLVEFTCNKCGYKNSYYIAGEIIIKCQSCLNGSKILPKVLSRKIPNWRLNVDDATEQEVLSASSNTFGMPQLGKEEWDAHYANEPYEVEKTQKFKKQQKDLTDEVLGSGTFSENQDGETSN